MTVGYIFYCCSTITIHAQNQSRRSEIHAAVVVVVVDEYP